MITEKVERLADAQGAICRDCGMVFNITTSPFWHWSKSIAMHRNGSKHKVEYYRLVPR